MDSERAEKLVVINVAGSNDARTAARDAINGGRPRPPDVQAIRSRERCHRRAFTYAFNTKLGDGSQRSIKRVSGI